MTISIIGLGNVGLALGKAISVIGETVTFGARDPAKYADAIAVAPGARLSSVDAAIDAADIVIAAVSYPAALELAGARADWGGRILVDVTNPLAPGLAGLTVGTTTSGGEEIARRAHNARVVKAFNTTGYDNMVRPRYANGATMMPVAGDDSAARAAIVDLAKRLGFDAFDFGPLSGARYLEPFAMTWIHMAAKLGRGRDFAFGLLTQRV